MASYGVKYKASFVDRYLTDISIEIRKSGYTGAETAITLTGDPVLIENIKKENIISAGCKLNIINNLTDIFEFANLNVEAARTYKLNIYRNSNLIFQGYLIPDVFTQDIRENTPIILSFNNGLAHLDRYYPDTFLGSTTIYMSEKTIIDYCLAYCYFGSTLYANSSLYEDNLTAAEKLLHPFANIYLNYKSFVKSDGNYDTVMVILNKILKSYNAILYEYYDAGVPRYVIEREIDRAKTTKKYFYGTGASDYVNVTAPAKTDLNNEILLLSGNSYTIVPPAKRYDLKLDYFIFKNLVDNIYTDFIALTAFLPTTISRWHYNSDYMEAPETYANNFIASGFFYEKKTGASWVDFAANARASYFTRFTKDADDNTGLSVRWKGVFTSIYDYTFRFFLYINDGSYARYIWKNTSGVWALTTAPTEISISISAASGKTEWDISEQIDLTGLLSAYADHIDLKFIMRPPLNDSDGSSSSIYVGDVEITTNNPKPDNLLEAELNNDMVNVIEDTLSLFDTKNWNYKNTKYRIDASGFYQLSDAWTDDTITSETLQNHYITNKGNYFNASRSKFLLIITRNGYIALDEMFETDLLQDELDQDITLTVEKSSYNVKKAETKVLLVEYISDLNKRIGATP